MLKHLTGHFSTYFSAIIAIALMMVPVSISSPDEIPVEQEGPDDGRVVIESIAPERIGGQAYRLVYRVNVPIATYWKFKTDFNNTFLLSNKFIRDHRFLGQKGDIAITETQYTYRPDVFFRWETRLLPQRFRLTFSLLNPDVCKQKYHHGYIQMESEGEKTRVTQVAFFDFWGAAFWAINPWRGGMRDFLSHTARWEQATAVRLKDRYHEEKNAEK